MDLVLTPRTLPAMLLVAALGTSAAEAPQRTTTPVTPAAVAPASQPTTVTGAPATPANASRLPAPLIAPLGVHFDRPLATHLRGGALPTHVPALPTAIGNAAIETRPGVAPVWVAIRPPTLPVALHRHQPTPRYGALVDAKALPVRVLAQAQPSACPPLFDALAKRLAERYGNAVAGGAPAGASHYALFVSARHYVQVLCADGRLALDYIDSRAYAIWLAEHRARIADYDRRARLALAANVAPNQQGRFVSGFGVPFDRPANLPGVMPDIDAQVRPPAPFAAWPSARYELMVDPDGMPIRIAARADFVDAAAATAERKRLSAALVERYGAPRRERPLHIVITRGNRHIVVAQEGARVSMVFLENSRLQAQRSRLQARQAELADAVARQRAAERAGL